MLLSSPREPIGTLYIGKSCSPLKPEVGGLLSPSPACVCLYIYPAGLEIATRADNIARLTKLLSLYLSREARVAARCVHALLRGLCLLIYRPRSARPARERPRINGFLRARRGFVFAGFLPGAFFTFCFFNVARAGSCAWGNGSRLELRNFRGHCA